MKDVHFAKANVDAITVSVERRSFDAKNDISCGYNLSPEVHKVNDDVMGAKLIVRAYAENILNVQVTVVGEFGMKNFMERSEDIDDLKYIAMTVMFPYARAAIDQACGLTGMFPLNLPILNTAEAFAPEKIPFVE